MLYHCSFQNLGLVPPTPPVSFAAADTPAAERITSFQESLKMSPDTGICTCKQRYIQATAPHKSCLHTCIALCSVKFKLSRPNPIDMYNY